MSMSDRSNGVVKFFAIRQGYGYITDEMGEDYFFSHRDLMHDGRFKYVVKGERVTFMKQEQDLEKYKNHRAVSVVLVETNVTKSEVKHGGNTE